MSTPTGLLLALLVLSATVQAAGSAERAGSDLDALPAGVDDDGEAAWVFAHSPAIHVTP